MVSVAFAKIDSVTWQSIALFLDRHELQRFGRVNRAARRLVTHDALMCQIMDRICGVDGDSQVAIFGLLRGLARWSVEIAASHGRETGAVSDDDPFEQQGDADGDGEEEGGVPRVPQSSCESDSPIVNVAVAVGSLVNYYTRLVSIGSSGGVGMSSTATASSTSGGNAAPPAGALHLAGSSETALDTLQVASRAPQAATKARLARAILNRGLEDLGEFVLPLAFACIVFGAQALRKDRERIVEAAASVRRPLAAQGAGDEAPEVAEAAARQRLEQALEAVDRLAGLLPVSREACDLMATLTHPTHLLAVLDRIAWHDEIAAMTGVENADDIHDLNENLQPLLSSAWLNLTDRVLKRRAKGGRWLLSSVAQRAVGNPLALARHIRWCRGAHRAIRLHQSGLPTIASFAFVADHSLANGFFQSLALATQLRLRERGVHPLAMGDTARFIVNPRDAHLEGVSVLDLLRVGELDPDFLAQLTMFDPDAGAGRP